MENLEIINSPLEQFEINSLISLTIPLLDNLQINLTNLGLYAILVSVISISIFILANNSLKLIPSKWSISLESIFATIQSMVKEQLGKEIYFPFIFTTFLYILLINLLGNIPYSFALSASAVVVLGYSLTTFLGVTIIGIKIHKIKFLSFFLPNGTPLALVPLLVLIEIISYLARSVSLGLRLFSNIAAGHILVKILSTFLFKLASTGWITAALSIIPLTLFVAILALELAVSIIQSYVWTVLSIGYLNDSIVLH